MFIILLAAARDVQFYMENPAGSMIFSFLSEYLSILKPLHSAISDRCAFSTEPMGSHALSTCHALYGEIRKI
jgi:hypothetical protein